MSSTTSSAISAQALEGNRLLALLPPETRRRMLPAFQLVNFDMSHVLYEPDRTITHIHFPLTAVTSVLSEMDDGRGRDHRSRGPLRDGLAASRVARRGRVRAWERVDDLRGR